MSSSAIEAALRIVRATPGYTEEAVDLAQMVSENLVRVDATLDDRAQAGLLGTLTLGPEAVHASPLSLAQTLVHEHFHLYRQSPWLKTLSFWLGVVTATHVMRRYERPAYLAAHDFLEAVKRAHPAMKTEATAEQRAIQQVFTTTFGGALM